MRKFFSVLFLVLSFAGIATGAETVPTDIQMPGTQPLEIGNLESPNKCDNCHGGYNAGVEPAHNWRGSMMAQAGRDPIFWATMAIAEQDFDGAGDLCLRCHSTGGWLAGRSTPTDGSGLASGDSDGVECDYCHKLTDPADVPFEPQGEMNGPFVANDGVEGWYGSGMSSMWGGADKLGPYDNADARHQFMYSRFHRSPEFCGTCHDVSNPAVGDLAHNRGAMHAGESVLYDGTPGSAPEGKAAFNNPPYAYGIVERTFSEHMSSPLSGIEVDDFETSGLPSGGAFQAIHEAATAATGSADYSNPSEPRYYTCQTCHMRPVSGTGANKRGVPVRTDLPLHDMTGGNYWMAEAIIWLDGQGLLRLGGGLSAEQKDAMRDAAIRAREQLQLAATLEVGTETENVLEVEITNHTGHKLITGYPEGRRMWLNVKWFDESGAALPGDEIGAYGDLQVSIDGNPVTVRTLINPETDHEHGYLFEAHMGITQEWATQLLDAGLAPDDLAVGYDRLSGGVSKTLSEIAGMEPGDAWPTFHFAINNTVVSDNRIPPFEMSQTIATQRNATPVPATLYLDSATGLYENEKEFDLAIPTAAARAEIRLLYQPTSWEYIQFLYLANEGKNAFLGNEGRNMLDAWLATGMAEPVVMASRSWEGGGVVEPPSCEIESPTLLSAQPGNANVTLAWSSVSGADRYTVYYEQAGKSQFLAELACAEGSCLAYTDSGLDHQQEYCYKVSATGSCESAFSNILCATPQPPGQVSGTVGVATLRTGIVEKSGKGKNATETFVERSTFTAGESVVIRMLLLDENGSAVSGATPLLAISGPESASTTATSSDASGNAESTWATQAPNRKGHGGTTPGSYTIAVSGIDSSTHDWDGVQASLTIQVQ